MSSLRRSMGVNLVFHYVGIGVALLQGIVLVPIYLRYLPLDLYGAWLAIGNVLGWLELVDPGLGSLLQQRVASTLGRAEHNRLPIVVGTGLVLGQMVAMLPLAALPFAESIARIANAPQHVAVLASSFRVGIISTCFVIASYSIFAVNLGLQRSLTAGIVNTSGSLLGLVATLVFLLKGHGLVSLPFGSLVRSTFFFVAGGIPLLIWARRNLPHLAFRTAELRELLGSASYTFVSRLGGIVVSRLDAVITAQLISPQAAAILSLTGKAMDIVRLAVERIGVAAMPGLAFVASNPDRARLVSNVNDLGRVTSRAVAVGAAAVVALNYFFLSLWVGPTYFGGELLTTAQALAASFSIMVSVQSSVVFALGSIRASSLSLLAEAIVKLPLQLLLARWLGLIGMPLAAALATGAATGWFIPVLAGRLLGLSGRQVLLQWLGHVAIVLLLVCCGFLAYRVLKTLPIGWTWWSFASTGCGLAALGAALVLAFDGRSRRLFLRVLSISH